MIHEACRAAKINSIDMIDGRIVQEKIETEDVGRSTLFWSKFAPFKLGGSNKLAEIKIDELSFDNIEWRSQPWYLY